MSRGIVLILPYISRRAGVLDPNLMNNPYCRYPLHWNLSILLTLRNSPSPPPSVHPFPELVLQRLNEIDILNTPGTHDPHVLHWDYSCNTDEWGMYHVHFFHFPQSLYGFLCSHANPIDFSYRSTEIGYTVPTDPPKYFYFYWFVNFRIFNLY